MRMEIEYEVFLKGGVEGRKEEEGGLALRACLSGQRLGVGKVFLLKESQHSHNTGSFWNFSAI